MSGQKSVAYKDKDAPGLILRVTENGSRTYYTVLWDKDMRKMVWRRIGAVGVIALHDARKTALRLAGDVANGVSLAVDAGMKKGEPTFGELVDGWLAMRAARGDRRVLEDREQICERWLGSLPSGPPRPHGAPRTKPEASVNWSRDRVSTITSEHVQTLITAIGEPAKCDVAPIDPVLCASLCAV